MPTRYASSCSTSSSFPQPHRLFSPNPSKIRLDKFIKGRKHDIFPKNLVNMCVSAGDRAKLRKNRVSELNDEPTPQIIMYDINMARVLRFNRQQSIKNKRENFTDRT